MSAVFVTATGTDIGKTFVAAGLIRHCRSIGRGVEVLKPVVTGFDSNAIAASDPGTLLAALGRGPTAEAVHAIAPWRYAAPLAPDMAARRERRALDFDALVGFCRDAIARSPGLLLIEGIGGAMVPLDERRTVLDWMVALDIPVLLVTGSYLGSLSHTLTCLDVLRRNELAIKAVVVNETADSTVTLAETVETLTRFADPIPVIAVPRLASATIAPPAFGAVAALL